MKPILRPEGPDLKDTEELIKTISTTLDSPYAYPDVKNHIRETIDAIVEGYKTQSGKEYTGFYPLESGNLPYDAELFSVEPFDEENIRMKAYFVNLKDRKPPLEWKGYEVTKFTKYLHNIERKMIDADKDVIPKPFVGFGTFFPHISKLFWFELEEDRETNCYVKSFDTKTLEEKSLVKQANEVHFACPAEATIAAQEIILWSEADTVEDYLKNFATEDENVKAIKVKNPMKLKKFYEEHKIRPRYL